DLGGRSVLQRSVGVFDAHPDVRELVVVLPAELMDGAADLVGPTTRRCRCVAGGAERHDSVRRGFAQIPAGGDLLLVHDAARPFADAELIDRVLSAARETGAAVPAMAARDTVKRLDRATGLVVQTIPREDIWLAQTPQGFTRAVLDRAMTAPPAAG